MIPAAELTPAALAEGVQALAADLKAPVTPDLPRIYKVAWDQVRVIVGTATIPDDQIVTAVLLIGSELAARRDSIGGILAQYGDLGGTIPVRLARDITHAARALLGPWLPGGFA